ncbi:MAG: hypothetical protein PHT40_03780 [Patescibacteria group bacterium]|nr:hypothetical protein [Patescibacteria group bacterium]
MKIRYTGAATIIVAEMEIGEIISKPLGYPAVYINDKDSKFCFSLSLDDAKKNEEITDQLKVGDRLVLMFIPNETMPIAAKILFLARVELDEHKLPYLNILINDDSPSYCSYWERFINSYTQIHRRAPDLAKE